VTIYLKSSLGAAASSIKRVKFCFIFKAFFKFQGGAFHYLEEFVGRALQRSMCLLHHVELVLRAIFEMYDGKPLGEKCL
jgi:hypothetical protein